MAFNAAITPFLVPTTLDSSYGMPYSTVVTGNPSTYNTNVAWSGNGGTLEIRTTGNLAALAGVNQTGVLAIATVGSEIIARTFQGGTGIAITHPAGILGDPTIEGVASSLVQLHNTQVNGLAVGSARNTINLVPGTGVSISGVDTGTKTNVTINSSGAQANGPFVIYEADADLDEAFNLGTLTSGILKQTVSSGTATPAIAVSNVDYLAADADLLEIAALSPGNGSLLYRTAGHWNVIAPGTVGTVLSVQSASSLYWADFGIPVTATVTTTDATPTTLVSVPVLINSVVTIEGTINAVNSLHNNACGGTFTATVLSSVGPITLVDTPYVVMSSTSTASFNVIVSGSNLIVQVTGIAGNTYNWNVSYKVLTN